MSPFVASFTQMQLIIIIIIIIFIPNLVHKIAPDYFNVSDLLSRILFLLLFCSQVIKSEGIPYSNSLKLFNLNDS